jgi:hypothetical protein
MSDTSCPSCDAPAAPAARRCARCGYDFVEDAGRRPMALPARPLLAAGGVAALVVACIAVLGSGGDPVDAGGADRTSASPYLEVVSDHPLSTQAAERLLEGLYTAPGDEESAAVICSGREAKPAHSVRRCEVRYVTGIERRVVLITNARGAEVLSKP